jgi:type I restriction enzyme S subunit
VAKLEKLLDKVDSCQKRLAKIPILLKRFRQAVLAAASSGRITEDWRNENDFDLGDWKDFKLLDLLAEPLANGRSVVDGVSGFPVLRLTCLKDGGVDLSERKIGAWTAEQARKFLVSGYDFLVARGNGSLPLVGRGGLVEENPDPVAYPDTLIRVRLDYRQVAPGFLKHAWNFPSFREQIERVARTTAGIWKISQRDLEGFTFTAPPIREQQEIARRVDQLFAVVDQVEARYAKAKQYVDSLKQSILSKAFHGELVPQDPNDEPATALLERIREARGTKSTSRSRQRVTNSPHPLQAPLF